MDTDVISDLVAYILIGGMVYVQVVQHFTVASRYQGLDSFLEFCKPRPCLTNV